MTTVNLKKRPSSCTAQALRASPDANTESPTATGHQPGPGSARSSPHWAATVPRPTPASTESVRRTKLRSRPATPPRVRIASVSSNIPHPAKHSQKRSPAMPPWITRGFIRRRGRLPSALLLVPGGQDTGAVLRDSDRELEVSGKRAIGRVHRPVVLAHADLGAAGVDHRLQSQDHPGLQRGALAGLAIVGDLRVLVHVAADSVTHQRADDREARQLDLALDRG